MRKLKFKIKPKTKPKRKKLITLPNLKKKLWIKFSEYIRLRDSNENGMCVCCTTGKLIPWSAPPSKSGAQAGHFFPKRGNPALYFEESNVNAQSPIANKLQRNGITWDYFIYMEKKWGRKELDRLAKLRKKPFKFTREWMSTKLEYYTKQVEILKQQKNL